MRATESPAAPLRMPRPFPLRRTFLVLLLVILARGGAGAEPVGPDTLRKRFDQIATPAIAATLRKAVPADGGQLAWGESYLLAALVEMFAVSHDPGHAASVVAIGDWLDRGRDDRNGRRDEIRQRVLPAWSSERYSKGQRYTWAVHTGMIAAPLARFAAIVRSDPTLRARWGTEADRLLRVAEEAVAPFDEDFRSGPGPDEGHLVCPYLRSEEHTSELQSH